MDMACPFSSIVSSNPRTLSSNSSPMASLAPTTVSLPNTQAVPRSFHDLRKGFQPRPSPSVSAPRSAKRSFVANASSGSDLPLVGNKAPDFEAEAVFDQEFIKRWAVDINSYACESLKLNHQRTEVRNEKAEDFLALLKEWEKLCKKYKVAASENGEHCCSDDDEADDSSEVPKGEFEVGKLVGICYGDPHNIGKVGLKFKGATVFHNSECVFSYGVHFQQRFCLNFRYLHMMSSSGVAHQMSLSKTLLHMTKHKIGL